MKIYDHGSPALIKAIDAINANAGLLPGADLLAAKARALMVGYDSVWMFENWETESVEEAFHVPLYNIKTGRQSRHFSHAGKKDGVIRRGENRFLLEHKTTSEDISEPDAPYFQQLELDAQISGYMLASWQQGQKLSGVLYDVIKKPGIKPSKITSAERQKIVNTGEYYGFEVPYELRMGMLSIDRETPELYEHRLATDCLANPHKYFYRKVIHRTNKALIEFAEELWDIAAEIRLTSKREKQIKNRSACWQYNTPCKFLGICSEKDSPNSDRWERVDQVHPELPSDFANSGREVLTQSRIKTYLSCRQKHYFQHVMGLRRVEEQDREALAFGTLLHCGLEAWWLCFRKEENGNDIERRSEIDKRQGLVGGSQDNNGGEADTHGDPCSGEVRENVVCG